MDDLIRNAIDVIEHRLAEPAYQHAGEDWYVGMNSAISELYNLPSVQPEPKKGHWMSQFDYCKKTKTIPSGVGLFWYCSECEVGNERRTNFCPNCGSYNGGD